MRSRLAQWVLWILFSAMIASAQTPLPKCVYHIPMYNAVGVAIPFTIVSVTPEGSNANLLGASDISVRFVAQGERLYFSEKLLRRGVPIVKLGFQIKGERAVLIRRLPLYSCSPRWSLSVGELDSGLDVSSSIATGRLTGCEISGDWWIRLIPMFGSQEGSLIHEGVVRGNGEFEVDASFSGERHIMVVGRDSTPLKVIGVNLTRGGKNRIGDVAMAGSCRK